MPGKIKAQITAKMVIASAERLMLVRHFCLSRNKMADISVPACPIPIQKTKFVMSNAQNTGLLLPQMPMPVAIRYPIRRKKYAVRAEQMAKATNQALGVFVCSGMRQTISVTEAKFWLPVVSGARCVGSLLVLSLTSSAMLMRIIYPSNRDWDS